MYGREVYWVHAERLVARACSAYDSYDVAKAGCGMFRLCGMCRDWACKGCPGLWGLLWLRCASSLYEKLSNPYCR